MLRSGDTIVYDTLVLAPGARMLAAFEDVLTFCGPGSAAAMRTLLEELEQGRARRIAFVAPTVAGWALPLYELALLTARHAEARGVERELVLVTPEPRPLRPVRRPRELGGRRDARREPCRARRGRHPAPSERSHGPGRSAGGAAVAARPSARRGAVGADLRVHPRRPTRACPRPRGRIRGRDATNFPIKQGGLATQQADAVAEHVAIAYVAALSIDDRSPCGRPRYGGQRRGRGTCAARACRSTRSGR